MAPGSLSRYLATQEHLVEAVLWRLDTMYVCCFWDKMLAKTLLRHASLAFLGFLTGIIPRFALRHWDIR